MKNTIYFCLLIFVFLSPATSCKKEQKQAPQSTIYKSNLLSLTVNNQFYNTQVDSANRTINIVIPHTLSKTNLTLNFTVSSGAIVSINNITVNTGAMVNLSAAATLKVTAGDNKTFSTWTINIETEVEFFGLGSNVTAEKSLNLDYSFYYDQFDGSEFETINCGPTVSTMALKWADSTFTKKPVDARNTIRSTGGWWTTDDIRAYLTSDSVNSTIIPLTNTDSLVKKAIDSKYVLVLCLDMYYVTLNSIPDQHTNKFYFTDAPGWGHFLLIKGYKQVDSKFYLEIYDPYSDYQYYPAPVNQIKGQDRYYLSTTIKQATDVWWPYTILVSKKGMAAYVVSPITVNSLHVETTRPSQLPVASGR